MRLRLTLIIVDTNLSGTKLAPLRYIGGLVDLDI